MNKVILCTALVLTMLLLAFASGKDRIITGKINDMAGRPISGATISVKGTSVATSSNQSGEFAIDVPARKSILRITALGYAAKEVRVGKDSVLTIALDASTNKLEEVVVIGYGSQKKSVLTGASIESINQSAYRERNSNLMYSGTAILSGRAPGIIYDGSHRKNKQYANTIDFSREGYDRIIENQFLKSTDNPLSTFSIDVDAASYSNVRRMLNYNQLPPAGAVRIEELINYFSYEYPQPTGADPFSINTEIAKCPWNEDHRLVSIGLQGKKVATQNLPASNLTFLIDVSGSMEAENKLQLVKASLKLLTDQLREQDKVSIVVYAGNAGLVLQPTSGANRQTIKDALERLQAGGSTAGGQGIQLAYKTAKENFVKGGNNRVILCTDGDFNVGQSSDDELERLIEEERKSGIFLTVLGYGTSNYQDAKMQKLADKGNGNHAYIDNFTEAKKVLVSEFGGTLFTIAKDVKLQIEFNHAKVQGYRLIGYENRMLAKEDFNNDKKDAGELGSGHTVTALYEIIPVGIKATEFEKVDELRYKKAEKNNEKLSFKGELLNIKLRYKQPDSDVSKLL